MENLDSLKILLIEDDDNDASIIEHQLSSEPCLRYGKLELTRATSLHQGLSLLKTGVYDLVLSDLSLPDSEGLEAIVQIKEVQPDVPVVILTGLEDRQLWAKASQMGAQNYVVKTDLSGGLLLRTVCFTVDSWRTHRKNNQLQAQLLQSQKMEAVGSLAGGIAHEINNKLCIVEMSKHFLYKKIPEADPLRKDIDVVFNACKEAGEITQQILTFGRRHELEHKPVDLEELVDKNLDVARRLIGEKYQVNYESLGKLSIVKADPTQVWQAALNLLINARDAMPDGGTIELRLEGIELTDGVLNPKIPYLTIKPGKYVKLSVGDHGTGIASDQVARVFEPFFTTKELGKGTGLGLSVIKGIMDSLGGYVNLDCELDVGCCFQLYFPVATAEEEVVLELPSEESAASSASQRQIKILYVEDDECLATITEQLLDGEGFQVQVASDGQEAVQVLEAHPEGTFDIIVSDVLMPRLGGVGLGKRAKEMDPNIKMVFVSGYSGRELDVGTEGLPEFEFLGKPFKGLDLVELILRLTNNEIQKAS